MRQPRATRARGFLSRGALLSLLVHLNLLLPLGIAAWVYGAREAAQRAEEVDVAFEDGAAADLPKDLPPLDTPPPDRLPPPAEQRKLTRKPTPEQIKKDEAKKDEKKPPQKPEPEVVVPPLPAVPPPPAPPPPPPEKRAHEKVVDLDNDKEVEAPKDAKYLAQKNNRAEVETRATDTNLEKAQKGESSPSAPSERHDQDPGADKQKIAELDEQKSALGRKAPDVTPHADPQVAEHANDEPDPARRSLLALRDPAPRTHELTPETADLSLPHAPDGDLSEARRAVRGNKSDPARLAAGKNVKLALTGKDYEYLFGADAEADRQLASKQRSAKQGRFQQRLARVRAALENFIPEVRPGNTTALNTRAAPFAAYIARMHRSIHKLWGFGQLEDWDEKSGSSPFNNMNLMTNLEIVLDRDGSIDKVTVVSSSGYLPYDAAAIDVAYSAGPYPDPPRAIRSKNGKIYIHWRFYRDERQCATSGVDYYVVDDGSPPVDDPDAKPAGASAGAPSANAPQPLPAATRATAGRTTPAVAGGSGGPAGSSPATAESGGGLRRLQRFDDTPAHRAGMRRLDSAVAAAEEPGGAGASLPQDGAGAGAGDGHTVASSNASESKGIAPKAADPSAHAAARRWFAALASGRASALADAASFPFKTAGKDVTTRASLTSMLSDLASEGTPKADSVQVFTAAGLRAAIGKLPPNLDDGGGGHLYAVASSGPDDMLILVLSEQMGGWKASGLVRR